MTALSPSDLVGVAIGCVIVFIAVAVATRLSLNAMRGIFLEEIERQRRRLNEQHNAE